LADQLFVDTLIRLIVRHFEMDPGQLSADSNLQHLGLDSIALAELLVVIEEETGIDVPLTDEAMPVGPEVTIAAVADYVARFADESALAVLRVLAAAPADADA
jgi:acyl carrier protein